VQARCHPPPGAYTEKVRPLFLLVPLCLLALSGCGSTPPEWTLAEHPDLSAAEARALVQTLRGEAPRARSDAPWQARVAGVVITTDDIDRTIARRYRQLQEETPEGAEPLPEEFFRQQALASLVEGARLAAEARRLSITPPRAEINRHLRYAMGRSVGGARAGSAGAYLERRQMTLGDWREEVARNLLQERILEATLPADPPLDLAAARRDLERAGPVVPPGQQAVIVRYFNPGQEAAARALAGRMRALPASARAAALRRAGGSAMTLPTAGGPPALAGLGQAAAGTLFAPVTIAGRPAVVLVAVPSREVSPQMVRAQAQTVARAERARRVQEFLADLARRYPVRYADDAPRPAPTESVPGPFDR